MLEHAVVASLRQIVEAPMVVCHGWTRDAEAAIDDHFAGLTRATGRAEAIKARLSSLVARIAMLVCLDCGPAWGVDVTVEGWRMPVEALRLALAISDMHWRSSVLLAESIVSGDHVKVKRAILAALASGDKTKGQVSKAIGGWPMHLIVNVLKQLGDEKSIFALDGGRYSLTAPEAITYTGLGPPPDQLGDVNAAKNGPIH